MQNLAAQYGDLFVASAFAVMLLAGFVKGTVGFALPMVAISGIGSLMSVETALAAIILPALITNLIQALRQGLVAAARTLRIHWRLNLTMLVMIAICAQLVVVLPDWILFTILGGMVTLFGLVQLSGWRPWFPESRTNLIEWITGLVAGFFGGISGVWGPPIVLYLLARETPKIDMVRTQGISYLIGSVMLVGAHLKSGVLNGGTVPFSALLVIPAFVGMWLGVKLQDRLDQELFRKLTLVVLVIAGLNLLRRGLL